MLGGQSTGHWGYEPSRLASGLHSAPIGLGMKRDAPDGYRSDAIPVEMHVHGGAVFHRRIFPLERAWTRGR